MLHLLLPLCWLTWLLHSTEAQQAINAMQQQFRRRRRIGRHVPTFNDETEESPPFTISNLTCSFITQPLNHFDLPRNASGTYRQRYCYYNGFSAGGRNLFDSKDGLAPVFLYVGNESPIETYINHTGLIWELAPQFDAIVVFLEHRYEGESLPDPITTLPPTGNGCMAYSSSIQALADASTFIQNVLFTSAMDFTHPSVPSGSTLRRRPVIAFGGSYGGMLAAWLRMKYPSMVAGAIAASAPIWGLPFAMSSFENNTSTVIDSASRIISNGLSQPYPPVVNDGNASDLRSHDDTNSTTNHCPHNLLAVWPLIKVLSKHEVGRNLLEDAFLLCNKLSNETNHDDIAQRLIEWSQSPWFDLAEGSYPYPSSYISFALTHEAGVKLPPWPVQSACWKNSSLYRDIGIRFDGNLSQVRYTITYGDSDLSLHVDWDAVDVQLPSKMQSIEELLTTIGTASSTNNTIVALLSSVRDAVAVWYNATLDLKCFALDAIAPNTDIIKLIDEKIESSIDLAVDRELTYQTANATEICERKMKEEGSWPSLCCNEEMNLIISYASGIGNDGFWPPTVPRSVITYAQLLNGTPATEPCSDSDGMFGYPRQVPDPWSSWYDAVYGGRHLQNFASNIVFSNGRLDPWSAAGVFTTPLVSNLQNSNNLHNVSTYNSIPGLVVQLITSTVIALTMDLGGHHTDLMYSNIEMDPPCVQYARIVERDSIEGWIRNFWDFET